MARRVKGEASRRDAERRGHVNGEPDGRATVRFRVCAGGPTADGAADWQPQLWRAVLASGVSVESFQEVGGRSLRDVIRYYSQEN